MHIATLANGFIEWLVSILEGIFDMFLRPLFLGDGLTPESSGIFGMFFKMIIDFVWELLCQILYKILTALLSFLEILTQIFDIFAGTKDVTMLPSSATGLTQEKTGSLIEVLIGYGPVTKAFWLITIFCAALCIIFTIFSTAKSSAMMGMGDRPISKIIGSAMKAMMMFAIIPLFLIIGLNLATVIMRHIDNNLIGTTDSTTKPTFSSIMFVSGTLDAATYSEDKHDFSDSIRNKYLINSGDYTYDNEARVGYDALTGGAKGDFDLTKYNWLLGFGFVSTSIMMMFIMMFHFTRRIIEILLLYITAPAFVSTIPLDDGAMFAKWRDMFIAKILSGFGPVYCMKLYMLFVPMIFDSSVMFADTNTMGSSAAMIDISLRIIFVLGGMLAVKNSQVLILSVISPDAAAQAQESLKLGWDFKEEAVKMKEKFDKKKAETQGKL